MTAPTPRTRPGRRPARPARLLTLAGVCAGLLALTACGAPAAGAPGTPAPNASGQQRAAGANPDLDPGTPLSGPAPGFRLVNQFGQPMSLSQFRGKVVILAFIDSRCTNVCPLTTAIMTEARDLLGTAGDRVQLLGVDANPSAAAVHDVMAYSQAHGVVNQWDFLTGPLGQLKSVWKSYDVYVQIVHGLVDHTPALFVIGTHGRERMAYLTPMAYASIGQQAHVLAQEASALLPGHPKLASQSSLAYVRGIGPSTPVTLPGATSGSVTLGPGRPHLVMFFATWLTETSDLRAKLLGLNGYARAARNSGLPALTAVDEAVTERSPAAAGAYLKHLGQPLDYPVVLDKTGRLADGYGVQDQPWFVLTSASGKIVWHHDGWLPVSALEAAAGRAAGSGG